MREITYFSANTVAQFNNNYENMVQFTDRMMNASNDIYTDYSKDDTGKMIRNQFNKIIGFDYKEATPMKRRQAWREHGRECCSLTEDVLVQKMNGWNPDNTPFTQYVEEVNLAVDQQPTWYVTDPSLLQVSKWAGSHHDIVRQKLLPGKSFTIELSNYVIKVYADWDAFMLGRIDFSEMVDRMYRSIEQYRYNALYTAFMSMDSFLPSDMILQTNVLDSTTDAMVEHIEAVKAAAGRDIILVGTRPAIQRLQNTVNYPLWSNDMKNEKYHNGILGYWNGYECFALDRVNVAGTRTSVFTAQDDKKIFILPVDPDFKPIKRVNAGDVAVWERGHDGTMQDRTLETSIEYSEGIGIVINELFGEIVALN